MNISNEVKQVFVFVVGIFILSGIAVIVTGILLIALLKFRSIRKLKEKIKIII